MQNTSFESLDTDQIFMTYVENDNKSTSDEFHQEMKQNQALIDTEIHKIRQNLQLPTVETEEDKDFEENKFVGRENVNRYNSNFQWESEESIDLASHKHQLPEAENQVAYLKDVKPKSLFNPLSRKLVLMSHDAQADIAEAKHCNVCTGFTLTPALEFTKSIEGGRYTAAGVIDHKDSDLILSKLINAPILKSFLCTPIKTLSCGFEHCAVLTSLGTVATWGYGASGCLGHNSYTSYTSPKLVQVPVENGGFELLSQIESLECGGYHTLCVDANNRLFAWGRGDVGQLGLYKDQLTPDQMGMVMQYPTQVDFFEHVPIVQVACGEAHSVALDRWGRV